MKNNQLELWDRYTKDALALECDGEAYDATLDRLEETAQLRIVHASMGMAGEAGEVLDLAKKHTFYGKDIDRAKWVEEIGDVCWYMAVLMQVLDVSMDEVLAKNISKLRARYGGVAFSSYEDVSRDPDKIREIMEEGYAEDNPSD